MLDSEKGKVEVGLPWLSIQVRIPAIVQLDSTRTMGGMRRRSLVTKFSASFTSSPLITENNLGKNVLQAVKNHVFWT